MSTQQNSERHLAMLIDGDNAQYKFIKEILEEVSHHGTTTYRRAYGDWTQPNLAGWRGVMQENAIDPIHKWRSANGKNATDIDLTINAMEILYTGKVQGFCIVSSDSDFTGLCMKIRDAGLFVMGIGEKKTPKPFVNACHVFRYVEDIIQTKKEAKPQTPLLQNTITKKPKDAIDLLHSAFNTATKDDGWVHLSALGDALRHIDLSFDSRTYSCKNLSLLIKSLPQKFMMKGVEKTGISSIYVRLIDA